MLAMPAFTEQLAAKISVNAAKHGVCARRYVICMYIYGRGEEGGERYIYTYINTRIYIYIYI
jgi:hypothetical protein